MAFQTIPGGFYLPEMLQDITLSFSSMLLDAASEKAAGILWAPKTGTINKIGFLTGTVTTGDTVDVRLETVDLATGDPSGALFDTNTNADQIIGDGDDNTWFTTALTAGADVTEGDLLAVVIANGATPGNLNIQQYRATFVNFPYTTLFTAAWVKESSRVPLFSLEYSDGSYAVSPGVYPYTSSSGIFFNNSDTPDERGLKFRLPFPVRITGAWLWIDADEAVDLVLYDSDGTTPLETVTLDKDVREADGSRPSRIKFSSSYELTKDTYYRLVVKPTTATDVEIGEFTVDAVAIMDALDGGPDFHHTSRTDAGSWTDTTTRRSQMGIICDAFDDGVSAGESDTVGNIAQGVVTQINQIVSY